MDGPLLRTGMGSIPNSSTWQVFKWGHGPYLDGLFTQFNFGIVTKLGMWLLPRPPAFEAVVIRFDEGGDINKIVETLRRLRIAMIIPNVVVIASVLWETGTFLKRSDYCQGKSTIPDAGMRRIMKQHDLGHWNESAALYATPDQIDVNGRSLTVPSLLPGEKS